jgi:hypothetical protein
VSSAIVLAKSNDPGSVMAVPGMRRSSLVAHRVKLHGVTAEVVAPHALNSTLRLVLAGYPGATSGDETQLRITVERVGDEFPSWEISDGMRKFPESTKRGSAAIRAEWLLVSEALKLWTHAVHVHAGLVGTRDRAALLIGRSGIGKSTTTMALGLAGLDVYTDDVALIERGTFQALSVPRPIKLDRKSRAMLQKRGLEIPRRHRLNESIDRTILPGLPPAEGPAPRLASAIFFAENRGERPSFRPITSAEAVMRLIQQSATEHFDQGGPSEGALSIVNNVPCYELVAADLDQTVQAILCHLGVWHEGDPVTKGSGDRLSG